MPLDDFFAAIFKQEQGNGRRLRPYLCQQYITSALFGLSEDEKHALLDKIIAARAADIAYERARSNCRYLACLDVWLARRGWLDVLPEPPVAADSGPCCGKCGDSGLAPSGYCDCHWGKWLHGVNGDR